jgi:hypothetical protein
MKFYLEILGGALLLLGWFMLLGLLSLVPDSVAERHHAVAPGYLRFAADLIARGEHRQIAS